MLWRFLLLIFCAASCPGQSLLTLEIDVPRPGAVYSEGQLQLTARVESEFEIASVKARLGLREIPLSFSQNNLWSAAGPAEFGELPSGTNLVTFTATDVLGHSVEKSVSIVLNRRPKIHVRAPANYVLADPEIDLAVDCDDPEGDCSILIADGGTQLLRTNVSSLRTRIDLSKADGSVGVLTFFAVDGPGSYSSTTRYYVSLNNPRLQPVESVDGPIYDFNDEAVLYRFDETNSYSVKRKDRLTGAVTTIATNFNVYGSTPRLISGGAIYQADAAKVVEARSNRVEHAGLHALSPSGRFGILPNAQGAILRDFQQGTNATFPDSIPLSVSSIAVADNGEAILSLWKDNGNELYQWTGGHLQLLEADSGFYYRHVGTDGSNFVWIAAEKNSSSGVVAVWAQTPQGRVLLSSNYVDTGSGPAYLGNDGWIAFFRPGSQGNQHVWTRSPKGVEAQATFFSERSVLRALEPDGTLLVSVGSCPERLYLARASQTHQALGRAVASLVPDLNGPLFYRSGLGLFYSRGSTIFRILPAPSAMALSSVHHAEDQLSFYVTATEPGAFEIERSDDLLNWTTVTSGTLTNTLPQKIILPVAPSRLTRESVYRAVARR